MLARTLRVASAHEGLYRTLIGDMGAAGIGIAMEPAEPVVRDCRPTALKRAITNLIDNAGKYGKTARSSIRAAPQAVEIAVDDS